MTTARWCSKVRICNLNKAKYFKYDSRPPRTHLCHFFRLSLSHKVVLTSTRSKIYERNITRSNLSRLWVSLKLIRSNNAEQWRPRSTVYWIFPWTTFPQYKKVFQYLYSGILFLAYLQKYLWNIPLRQRQMYLSICILGFQHMYLDICIPKYFFVCLCPALVYTIGIPFNNP